MFAPNIVIDIIFHWLVWGGAKVSSIAIELLLHDGQHKFCGFFFVRSRSNYFVHDGQRVLRCVFKFCMLQIVFAYQTLYLEEIRREQNSSRCDHSRLCRAFLNLKTCMQNKFSTWKMNNGECFYINSDILKYSIAMSDLCENWESTPGPKLMFCESRAMMKLPNFCAYCL